MNVSRETSARLARFADLLLHWNQRINLIGRADAAILSRRHIDDSLRLIDLLPHQAPVVDLGSGAGFPGLVIGIATGRPVTLVEADQRKASFLREAARVTETEAIVFATRIEDCGITAAPLVTARALAPLDRLLDYAAPLLHEDGMCLFPKGARVEDELTHAETRWQMTVRRHPTGGGGGGCVLEVRHPRPISSRT